MRSHIWCEEFRKEKLITQHGSGLNVFYYKGFFLFSKSIKTQTSGIFKKSKTSSMKRYFLFSILFIGAYAAHSQSMVTISGGYSFANLGEIDASLTGYRINGLYEFNPYEGPLAHGLSIGYINTNAPFVQAVGGVPTNSEISLTSWPIYYAPKYMFGEGRAKGFVKGAIGFHFTKYSVTPSLIGNFGSADASVSGLYGGASAGFMFDINEKIFINAEYEIAFLANYYYSGDVWMNSPMAGIGIRL
jgi:hypothetical protein